MQTKDNEIDIDDILNSYNFEKDMHNDYGNGIILTENNISILNKYNFDYKKYSSIKALLFDVEEYLNDNGDADNDDLDFLASELAERNYYQNVNK